VDSVKSGIQVLRFRGMDSVKSGIQVLRFRGMDSVKSGIHDIAEIDDKSPLFTSLFHACFLINIGIGVILN
jgi:hypothetical protein